MASETGVMHFSSLRATLASLLDGGLAGQEGAHALRLQLEKSRAGYRRILEKQPPSQQEKQELERGSFTPLASSSAQTVNREFTVEALFLASQLGISERLAASILLAVLNDHKPRPGRPSAENAVVLYYEERRDLLLSLQLLYSYASDAETQQALDPHIRNVLLTFANELITSEDAKEGSWVKKVLKEIDNQSKAIEEIKQGSTASQGTSSVGTFNAGTNARFNEQISELRVQSHLDERRLLSTVLYFAASARMLSKGDVLAFMRWAATLKDPSGDLTTPINLVTILAILDPTATEPEWQLMQTRERRRSTSGSSAPISPALETFFSDSKFISDLHSFITTKVNWKSGDAANPIQPVVQLAWCLFIVQAFKHRPALLGETKIQENAVEDALLDAIHSSALDFCKNNLLRFKLPEDEYEELGWNAGTKAQLADLHQQGQAARTQDVDASFQEFVLQRIDSLVESLITNTWNVLRKIRHREEDVQLASSLGRTSGTPRARRALGTSSRDQQATQAAHEQRHDIEALFSLIATLYRKAPDAALKYWLESDSSRNSSRLSFFLRWAAECRPSGMQRAFYDMLGSLATGPQSATYAYEFLAQNSNDGSATPFCSWATLFGALSYLESPSSHEGGNAIPPDEIIYLKSFLRLLRIVVSSSSMARATLYDNQQYKPINSLFGVVSFPVPLDLKAALLEAIAAFTRPAAKEEGARMAALGTEIAKRAWLTLESSQILPTIPQRDARGLVTRASSGLIAELDMVETPGKVYPVTTAFIALLASLLGGSTKSPTLSAASIGSLSHVDLTPAARTIPDNLGSPHRSPAQGIEPYTRYVIDEVLLKRSVDQDYQRDYASRVEQWRVVEACLAYVERCLAGLSFVGFLSEDASNLRMDVNASTSQSIYQLLQDPGFDIILRLLSGSKLLEKLFELLGKISLEDLDNPDTPALCIQATLRTLSIVLKVFELQPIFLEVVVPALVEKSTSLPSEKVNSLRAVQPLDQYLLYSSNVVVQIAVFVSNQRSSAISLASVRLLTHLAESSTFNVTDHFRDVYSVRMNRLAGLIDASEETVRVKSGFVSQLNEDDLDNDPSKADQSFEAPLGQSLDSSIKSGILDLLLANTQPNRPAPNIAHLLLGCDIKRRAEDLDFEDSTSTSSGGPSCLHVILHILHRVYESTAEDLDIDSVIGQMPSLAEKCYRLVRQLCLHDYTSTAITRFLRKEQNYFLLQSSTLPLRIPAATAPSTGVITFADGTEQATSADAVYSTLHSQAWLLETLALELNSLVVSDQTERAVHLLNSLYGSDNSLGLDDEDVMSFGRNGVEQPLARMLDILYSLEFSWKDGVHVNETPINLYSSLRFDTCIRNQPSGCQIYDFQAVLSLLSSARRSLQDQGALNSQQQQDAISEETRAILENLIIENHRREIDHARLHTLQAWRSVLDITLTRAFHLLPRAGSDGLLLDLLLTVLSPIGVENTDVVAQEVFAGAAVLLTTELRQMGLRQQQTDDVISSQVYSPDRLHPILQATLQAVIRPGVPTGIRGNLYAVLLQYIQHCAISANCASTCLTKALPTSFSLTNVNESIADDTFSLDGVSTIGGTRRAVRRSPLESGNLSIFQAVFDRLLPAVCLDAAAGNEVWQTVAFTMLDALYLVAGEGSAANKLSNALSKQGYLQTFVASIKESEAELLDVLKPDPDSLNALYAYEAKMSFMTRIASTREGAERLLDAQALPKLAQCSFFDARPLQNYEFMEYDSFLPPVTQRHHQLVLPALQVALAVLTGCGSHNAQAARQALTFIIDQRDAMKTVLDYAAQAPSLVALQEAHLLAQLMKIVLPVVSDDELTSPVGYGGLQTSLLGLSSAVMDEQDWIDSIQPSNADEQADEEKVVPDINQPSTLFREKRQALIESLQMSILEYMKAMTKRPGTNLFRPTWLPTFQVEGNSGTGRSVSAPTLRGAFVFLLDNSDLLVGRLAQHKELKFKIDNFDDIGINDLEVYEQVDEDDGLLDSQARRQHIMSVLLDLHKKLKLRLLSSLHLVELSLLLIWRHLGYYLDESRQSNLSSPGRPRLEGSKDAAYIGFKSQSMRGNVDTSSLRQNAQAAFKLALDQLENFVIDKEAIGVDGRSHEALMSSLLRSMLDLLGRREDA